MESQCEKVDKKWRYFEFFKIIELKILGYVGRKKERKNRGLVGIRDGISITKLPSAYGSLY
jgi:hypothetical protein